MKTNFIVIFTLLTATTFGLLSCTEKNTNATELIAESKTVSEGEVLFKANCTACHVSNRPEDMSKLVAPPMMGVMKHVKSGIEGKNEAEKRTNSIAFIVDYAQYPSAEKSLLEAFAIERFGVMPSQKENVTAAELTIIANYLYDTFPPKGFKHGEEKGCGNGCGGNCEH